MTVTELPIYEVTSTGIEESLARKLADALGIPEDKLVVQDGIASFLDPVNYLAVPTVTVDEPDVVASLLEKTKNPTPEKCLEVKGIDYDALSRLCALSPKDALDKTTAALAHACLTPHSATPVVGHTIFKTVSTRVQEGVPESTTTKLDTHVSYRFTLDGYLLVGAGAQVQINYGPRGNVTRLLYSTRGLKKGPSVKLISADTICSRFKKRLPDDAEVTIRLVYWAPPLRAGICASPRWSPGVILPWYAVTTKRQIINPGTRAAQTQTSRVRLIPATDDFRFIPSVSIAATAPQRSLVEARASVTGGTPPYTYLWAGSTPEQFSFASNSICYTPLVRDHRRTLRAQSFEKTENLTVTVIDANGVSAQAAQAVQVTAHPHPVPAVIPASGPTYGCESPKDPGEWSHDRIAWQQGMATPGQGGGTQCFCWTGDCSWPGDYIVPNPPDASEANPWIYGDADSSNRGINTTNIMLYIGDGGPNWLYEMYPYATPDDYSKCLLWDPTNGVQVQIGSQSYVVNYNGSWGAPNPNGNLQWLVGYACELLAQDSINGNPWDRWGPAFNGLHSLLAFTDVALDDNGTNFMLDFPANILGTTSSPQTIVQGWLNAAISNQIGTPAAIGPIRNVQQGLVIGVLDYDDYYWGKGSVGPNISQCDISGWWFIQGTDAVQVFP